MTYFLILFILFNNVPVYFGGNELYSQEIQKSIFSEIELLLDSGQLNKSEKLIQEKLLQEPNDPKLLFLETELWIKQANNHYNNKKYESSFKLYAKAYERWPNHPTVKERYFYLKDKNLKDELNQLINEQEKNTNSQKSTIDPKSSEQMNLIIKQLYFICFSFSILLLEKLVRFINWYSEQE